MKKYLTLFFSLFVLILAKEAYAVQSDTVTFSLEECIAFALKNNLELRHKEMDIKAGSIDLARAKNNLLPSINGSTQYYFNQGRSLDPVTNAFTDAPVKYQKYGLNVNLTLFDGLMNFRTIKNKKEHLQASIYGKSAYQRVVIVDIVKAYLDVLLLTELLKDGEQRSRSTLEELHRTERLVKAGEISPTELSQLKAQYADNQLTVISRKNDVRIGYLQLQQLLNVSSEHPFQIEIPAMAKQNISSFPFSLEGLYEIAQQLEPGIKEASLKKEIAEREIAIARGNYYPQLQLLAGAYSSHSSNPAVFLNESSYLDQLDFNLQKFVGFELSIPVSNNGKIKSQVQKAKVLEQMAEIDLLIARQSLWKALETVYANALAAKEEYHAATTRTLAVEEAYENASRQFELGVIDAIAFSQSQSQLENAVSYQIQRKYEAVFYQKMLSFYQGQSLNL